MLRLGVNVDHVATLRQARYRGCEWGEPDPVVVALARLWATLSMFACWAFMPVAAVYNARIMI